jgi:hypothetical protein
VLLRPRIMTALSQAHLGHGNPSEALRFAAEGVAEPTIHDARVIEINAQLALARALLAEIAEYTGDASSRALQLRSAHDLYTEMGATGHARRTAAALASGGHIAGIEPAALQL